MAKMLSVSVKNVPVTQIEYEAAVYRWLDTRWSPDWYRQYRLVRARRRRLAGSAK
jgi:hypothetical protein